VTGLRLPYRPPLSWPNLLGFLGPRCIPGVEEVVEGTYRRAALDAGGTRLLVARPLPDSAELLLTVGGGGDPTDHAAPMARLLDLDADPAAVDGALAADPVLAPLVAAAPGLRSPGAFDLFQLAVRAILGQQISVPAATTITGRLVRIAGSPLPDPPSPGLTHRFPTPAELAEADLASLGVPGRRAATLRRLGAAIAAGDLDLEGDPATVVERLLALPGLGPWTVSYIAMRGLGASDELPVTDLGIRRVAERLGLPTDPRELQRRAEVWRPYRSYAAHHLWASLGAARGA
jgi:AraC family transcriptional regulator, regulatory protein of adaptative response / DNA-3-methyladenine glycosylase II